MRPALVLICAFLIGLGGSIGCSSKKEQAEERQQTSGGAPVATPSDSGRPASPTTPGTAPVDTVGSVDELFSQIHERESLLSQSIAAGRLNELGTEVAGIRELLSKAVKLAQVPPAQRAEFEEHVAEAKRVSTALAEAGRAGSVEECKALNADLQKQLTDVERMILRPRTPHP